MIATSTTNNNNTLVATAIGCTVATLAVSAVLYQHVKDNFKRQERYRHVQEEIEAQDENDEVLPSILSHFSDLKLEYSSSVEEANKRRTTKYYQMARDAHKYDLVPGIRSYPRLRLKREAELRRIYQYRNANKSHRTVIAMCDPVTSQLLQEARQDILAPLQYSTDIATSEVWIPQPNIIPMDHLHVTIAIPWWWHGIRPDNLALTQELVARFRQALVTEFHHAFQLELERIVLLGGKTLVALWRTVGERQVEKPYTIFDRHGEGQDPLVKLRRDIVQCFTSQDNQWGQQPLTYTHRYYEEPKVTNSTPTMEPPQAKGKLKRRNTIELKTPGLGDHDGFIHTTLARLPIDCLSMTDVELEPIHRLCREATATYCGHRMVVSKFRFLETTGEGGESDPVELPIFDEVIEAPAKVEVGVMGEIQQVLDLHASKLVERSATIGNLPPSQTPQPSNVPLDELFEAMPAAEVKAAVVEAMKPKKKGST